jgi:hypothetical protein
MVQYDPSAHQQGRYLHDAGKTPRTVPAENDLARELLINAHGEAVSPPHKPQNGS